MKRKFKNFLRYFLLCPLKIDKDIKNILENLNYGHVAKKQTLRSAKPLYVGANPTVASKLAGVVELPDTKDLKSFERNLVRVGLPPPAPVDNFPNI